MSRQHHNSFRYSTILGNVLRAFKNTMPRNSLRVYSVHALMDMNDGITALCFALKSSKLFSLQASVGEYSTAWSLEASLGSCCSADHVCSWTVRQPFSRTERFRGVELASIRLPEGSSGIAVDANPSLGLTLFDFSGLRVIVKIWLYLLQFLFDSTPYKTINHCTAPETFLWQKPWSSVGLPTRLLYRSYLSPLSVQLMYQEPA